MINDFANLEAEVVACGKAMVKARRILRQWEEHLMGAIDNPRGWDAMLALTGGRNYRAIAADVRKAERALEAAEWDHCDAVLTLDAARRRSAGVA